jgi:hypothetical protein
MVVACERDRVLVQAVLCPHERQPPTPTPSPRPLPAQRRGDLDHHAQARVDRQRGGGRLASRVTDNRLGAGRGRGRLGGEVGGWAAW